ncbi:MAG: S41 family peptidase [Anaerolineales bacterium]|nr:S41 family peptidase [Anaerolineales bacterium]MCX7608304.1 S41 family peptidase [Anaerolineales bacterium]MDW8227333.1 S41 family peptidase [Anaerolineales bacterium]
MKQKLILFSLMLATLVFLLACQLTGTTTPTSTPTSEVSEDEPYLVTGSMEFTNSFIVMIFEEHAVALVDMYGFVIRDMEWEIPVESQTLGFMRMDEENLRAEYRLQLPAKPTGQFADVDNDGQEDTGVQIFAVAYWPNVYGGPYSEGDDRSRGWVGGFASVTSDPERDDEINGGKLLVWAPDDQQAFPTGYGPDNKLFTADDPTAPIPAGWTMVDLDQTPFAFIKQAELVMDLTEPSDYAVKDYSNLSYTEAFDKLIEFLRKNYAFNGIPGKEPDYDRLVAELRPRIQEAEAKQDAQAYYLALRDLTWAFKDGHVGIDGGDYWYNLFMEATSGGYGFAIQELDDGSFVNIYLTPGGPAEKAGMKVGALVTHWNSEPISEAVSKVIPWSLPQSAEWLVRYQQARYLLRAKPGDQATVTFVNPGGQAQTVTLTAIAERDSFSRTSIYYNAPDPLLPVEFKILDSGVGYVAIYSEADDIQLTIRLFERALKTFQEREVPGIIIDMRYNGGGTPLGLAGFLTDQEISLGTSYYFNEVTGKFEPEGIENKILPNQNQYRFDKIVVLVGPACASACEEESYGFSKVPGAQVVGMFPSAAMFGEVSRGQFIMPEGFSMQFPTGRYLLPDGTLFLEGTGVQPTLRVPRTFETVSSTEDVVLKFGENAILLPLGAGIQPATQPTLLSPSETENVLSSAKQFEELARENYTTQDYLQVPKTFTFTIPLSKSQTLLWAWGWCAANQTVLTDNLNKMSIQFTLNGQEIPLDKFLRLDYDSQDGQRCTAYLLALKDWAGGQHQAITRVTFKQPLNDGTYDFPAGEQVFEYNIYIKP